MLAFVLLWQGAVSAQVEPAATFAMTGKDALTTLLSVYYAGNGYWRLCNETDCARSDSDWGADSATDALYLRWTIAHDPGLVRIAAELRASSPRYPDPCTSKPCPWWSDTPAWDAVASLRESEMLGGNADAVSRAQSAVRYVLDSKAFSGGACPDIPYQRPLPSVQHVKTLETDATVTKALVLLYAATLKARYLDLAIARYQADRRYFLDPGVPLYTVHVIDDGESCVQEPHRFFASVNGEMISNGLALFRLTADQRYFSQALSTARAVDTLLSDERGVFADLQGENDVVEPLVEAMEELAVRDQVPFAREWILRNARAALASRNSDGTFPRFFDGPPQSRSSIWESNGAFALEIAAAALDPNAVASPPAGWQDAQRIGAALTQLPATIAFDGSGVALVGTIGKSCETAHLRVFVDGVETFDRTGLWQNHSMPTRDSVRFAWRWPTTGHHVIRIEASNPQLSASGPIHLTGVVTTGGQIVSER